MHLVSVDDAPISSQIWSILEWYNHQYMQVFKHSITYAYNLIQWYDGPVVNWARLSVELDGRHSNFRQGRNYYKILSCECPGYFSKEVDIILCRQRDQTVIPIITFPIVGLKDGSYSVVKALLSTYLEGALYKCFEWLNVYFTLHCAKLECKDCI